VHIPNNELTVCVYVQMYVCCQGYRQKFSGNLIVST